MRPADWLLIFVAAAPEHRVDPVRAQKGLFLLAMSGALPAGEAYEFEPYAYGPMSRRLYVDVRELARAGVLEQTHRHGTRWRHLEATLAGVSRAHELRLEAARSHPGALRALEAIQAEIATLSFGELLRRVYDRYPEYAVRSVFRGAT